MHILDSSSSGTTVTLQSNGLKSNGVTSDAVIRLSPPAPLAKRPAKRWDDFFTPEFFNRRPSRMQSLHIALRQPGILSLGPGAPRSQYFPIHSLDVKVPSLPNFSEQETRENGVTVHIGKYDMKQGKSEYDLAKALDYGLGTGSQQLVDFMTEHVEQIHNPPYSDWECILTPGNTYMLDLAFRMFMSSGDYMLVEEYTYPTALETGEPMGVKFAGVPLDDNGILPDQLDLLLENWDAAARGGSKPKVLYTVPTGQNPTGCTGTRERRQAVYNVCQKHNIYILEDDPYYYVQMHDTERDIGSTKDFAPSLVPSYLALDTDGRVLRMDSFSKVMAPGSRLGWVTASSQVIERVVRAHETSLQNPSGISQAVVWKILREQWSHDGFSLWLRYLQKEYTVRRDHLIQTCEAMLPKEIIHWSTPASGFFLWLKVDWQKHPQAHIKSVRQIEDELYESSCRNGALYIPGSWFQADPNEIKPNMFIRLTYAALDAENIVEAVRRFNIALRESFGIS